MQVVDTLTLDAPRITQDGYLAVRARAARTGVYEYAASEIGAPDTFKPTDTVKVYRDEAEVFARDSVASFLNKPITNDHPATGVNAANWRDHAVGNVAKALREGEFLAFDLVLMDAAAIADVKGGKRELSNGYSCKLDWTPGTAPDGTAYDARQTNIRGNHVALVDQGRAGPHCAIKDGFAVCDANPAAQSAFTKEDRVSKTITLDGLPVNLGDVAAVEAAIAKITDRATTAETALADANTKVGTLTGEKVALEAKLADAVAKADPVALDKRVADRAALIAKAKGVHADVVTDGKTDAEIMRAVVDAKAGEAAKSLDDAGIAGAFVMLAADSKSDVKSITPAANVADGATTIIAVRAQRNAALSTAYRA
jgi:uncharacterized protein